MLTSYANQGTKHCIIVNNYSDVFIHNFKTLLDNYRHSRIHSYSGSYRGGFSF